MLTGCASVTQGFDQPLKVETLTKSGTAIEGADCQLTNDKGTGRVMSGQSTIVRRSGGNLQVNCTLTGQPAAIGQAISRANAGMAGNILIGGVIGAAVDASTGSAFTYPTWIQLVFGEERIFDRQANRSDTPSQGVFAYATESSAARPAGAPASAAAFAVAGPAAVAATALPAAVTPAAAPSQTPASTPAPVDVQAGAQAAAMKAPLRRGDALEYMLVDQVTGRRATVMYYVDRADGEQVVFNRGGRVEKLDGQVSVTSAAGGLFDSACPPGGWVRRGVKPGMRWTADFVSIASGNSRHQIDATATGMRTARVDGQEFPVVVIDYSGWIYDVKASTIFNQAAPFRGVALYSPDLDRVVQFDASVQPKSGPTQESLQLVRIMR